MNIKGMIETDVAATTIGAFDLFRGAEYLKELIVEQSLPVVSANVFDESTGELFVEPYTIVERGGVRFGITGILDPEADIRTHKDVEVLGVTIGEPTAILADVVAELTPKTDFIILLSQMGLDGAKRLAEEVPGVDFLLVGGEARYSGKAFEVGQTAMMQPGYKGQRMCDFRLSFNAEHVYEGYSGQTLDLGDKVPSDAAMALQLKEHKIAIEDANRRRAAERNKEREAQQTPKYKEEVLGMEASCARCHAEQVEQWATTAHSHAYATLETGHQATNPECLRCHTTGYLDMPLDGSATVKEHLRNVQCESCHGKATDHARDGSYGKVTVATCVVCHDKENSPDFDFAEYLAKVVH
jgi:2',3'-cyclic-nucleotide 2'-phosphodiesterase (5'-nucleotidase family)